MEIVVLSIHLLVCVCLIGLVLLQRSEGGALGMGGGGGGALMSGRGAADALARMTSVAGGFFLVTSLTLTVMSGAQASNPGAGSVFDRIAPNSAPAVPAPTPATPPADDRPDPTESSVPADTQLASITPGPAEATAAPVSAPPANTASARAAPLTPATNNTTQQRTTTPPPQRTTPVSVASNTTTQPRSTPPRQTTTQRSTTTPATQRSTTGTTTPASNNRQLVLPNTSGSVTGIALDETPSEPESVEVGNGLEAVRRQTRAGPDQ